ncbi:DUF418 domain-containing protein [Stenotrophomonas sp. YIM B06876]|uniref:DUF418 domain-containing protein n=1 Tax=Stenotrophomonas sp. YIM B06876 TaxID=3060211 RepID=UPI002738DED9|nr:DUF418 domain-containing protein [Stenotrophomonas sp. YIM B06876]
MSSPVLQPVAPAERIVTLDVLRGFALFGILLMNMEAFSGPLDLSFTGIDPHWQGLDRWADGLVYIFVQGKFFTLFSLLFGAGFALMAQRAEVARRDFTAIYLRRSGALLLIGLTHALLIWSGDILFIYALLSFPLLAFREAPRSWLPALGGLCYLAAIGVLLWLGLMMALLAQSQNPPAELGSSAASALQKIEQQRQMYGHGGYWQAVAQRGRDWLQSMQGLLLVGPEVFGMFLIGAWFTRSGAIAHPGQFPRLFVMLRWLALPLGLALMLLSAWQVPWLQPGRFDLRLAVASALAAAAGLLMCLGYLGWVVRWRAGLAWLAPAGRMALSNYLGQSLLCTAIFYGYGLGAFEQMGRAWQLLFAVVLFALQLGLSHCWLRYFRFGPVEWLWRAATYLHWPPMRRQAQR